MISAARRRLTIWLPIGLAVLLVLVLLFRPRPVAVDFAAIERGPLQVTVSDDGETRVKDMFVVSAPVTGRMRRIELEPGDEVVARKTVIARIDPTDLDVRSETEARAAVRAAEASRTLANAAADRARAEMEFAQSELRRLQALADKQVISERDLEAAQSRERAASAAMEEARAMVGVRESQLQSARARLLTASGSERNAVAVRSPVGGRVLRVLVKSEGVVGSGTPLVEVGDPTQLEMVVDLLSTDAVRVRPGQRAFVEAWGGAEPIEAVVQRVEPSGFTKVSALGVEEQRVNVILDFAGPPEKWQSLGHGYRVEPRIVLREDKDAIKIPLSALFRDGERWATFVDDNGRAELRHVQIGRQNGRDAQVLKGLRPAERVVLHPGDRVEAGVRLTAR